MLWLWYPSESCSCTCCSHYEHTW